MGTQRRTWLTEWILVIGSENEQKSHTHGGVEWRGERDPGVELETRKSLQWREVEWSVLVN